MEAQPSPTGKATQHAAIVSTQSREDARDICKLKLKNKAVEGSKEVERKEGNAFGKNDIQCAFKSELRYAKEKF
ncbi:hypothetical protein CAJAP_04835 [Camponotus japonicus]